jgi:hypothetical protein
VIVAGRLTRFLNLERARKPDEREPHVALTKERFGAEPPRPADFQAERAAQLESGIEVETGSAAEQPFLRCPVCEADNTRYALRCLNCGRALDTGEVHAWNEQYWARRRTELEQEHKAEAKIELQREAARNAQRELGEMLAQQMAEHEQARLGWMGDSRMYDSTPWGMRILNLISSPGTRFAVAMGLVLTFFGAGAVAWRAHDDTVRGVAGFIALALVSLFLPNWRGRPRRWFWW